MVPLYISSFGPDPQQQIQQNNQLRLMLIWRLSAEKDSERETEQFQAWTSQKAK